MTVMMTIRMMIDGDDHDKDDNRADNCLVMMRLTYEQPRGWDPSSALCWLAPAQIGHDPHKFLSCVSNLPRFLLTWGLLSLTGGGGNVGGRGGLLIKIQHCNDLRIESASANTCQKGK